MTITTDEAGRLARFHALSAERYDAEEESGLKACATMTAAALLSLSAERDALREAADDVLNYALMPEWLDNPKKDHNDVWAIRKGDLLRLRAALGARAS